MALDALKQHQARQLEARLKAGAAWEDHDYVFCTPFGKHLDPGHDVLVQLKKLLAKAGLADIRFHDLRHSSASLLLGLGVHPKVVQELLGHMEISTTMNIYSHVLPTMQRDAMEQLNRKLQSRAFCILLSARGNPRGEERLEPLLSWLEAHSQKQKVPRDGIEPTTPAFSVLCSTN
jgi:Phage integrase family